jgi:hypothetical protein
MTNHIAPQEDERRLPASWTASLLPRRGRDKPDVQLDPRAPAAYRKWIRSNERVLRKTLRYDANLAWTDDASAYLLGEPNPRGAAAVAALMPAKAGPHKISLLRPALDAWVPEFGLAFATAAAVERLALVIHGGTVNSGRPALVDGLAAFPQALMQDFAKGIPVLRGLLATASDEDYAAAVAAVAPLRHEPARRMAVALLMPEETEWTDEASHDFHGEGDWASHRLLWNWVRTPEQLAAGGITALSQHYTDTDAIAALADGAGTASLPVLTATLERIDRPTAYERRILLTAIAGLPSDEAMDYLIDRLRTPGVFAAASTAAGHFPIRALRRIARAAATVPAERRTVLAGLATLIDTGHRDHLDAGERTAVEDLIASTTTVPEAAAADLPTLLTAPPWARKGPRRKPVTVAGLKAPTETVMVWAAGEQERWHHLDDKYYSRQSDEYWRELEAKTRRNPWTPQLTAFAPLDIAAKHAPEWNGHAGYGNDLVLQRILARFGADVADRALKGIAGNPHRSAAMLPIRNLTAARIAAERLRLKSTRSMAAAWFDRHRAEAATLLIPDALGSGKQLRDAAEAALVHLRSSIGPHAVRDAAEPYGAEAVEAVRALMDTDPLEPFGVKVPKLGTWANAAMLPQPLMTGRETALPAASVPHLITVLALGTPELPYAGVDVVAETCDRESLRHFSWALFEQWIAVGAPSGDGWALTQLAHFADDATVGRLTAMIREWPGESQHKRAITGLKVLGAIGSESALRAIHGISRRVKFKALKEEAGRQIEAVAEGLGLSTEQLADRLVPDFGLEGDSSIVLDYGPRQFKIGFDEALKPFVADMDGKLRKALPKPAANDDAELAEAARARFTYLKKELRTVAADLVTRLESAMIQGRTWTGLEFRRHFTDHPLVRHLTRRLVWAFEDDGRWTAFRVAEDRTFSDAEDDEITLPEGAAIRLAHPIILGDEASAWGQILADYEILQPFDQLGRPVLAFEDGDLDTGRLTRFEGITVETGRILGMTKHGWARAEPADAGMEAGITYRIADDAYLLVELDPGLYAAAYDSDSHQNLRKVWLAETASFWRNDPGPEALARFADLDPLQVSEALATLTRLARI